MYTYNIIYIYIYILHTFFRSKKQEKCMTNNLKSYLSTSAYCGSFCIVFTGADIVSVIASISLAFSF